jgi:hypothetical protein
MKKLQKATDETYLMIESHEAETQEKLSVPANDTVKVTEPTVQNKNNIDLQRRIHTQMAGGRFCISKKKGSFHARKCKNIPKHQKVLKRVRIRII